jgi:hypothetical protein
MGGWRYFELRQMRPNAALAATGFFRESMRA